jgi:hypothetical protein
MISPSFNWILGPVFENAEKGARNRRNTAIELPHKSVRFSGNFP